MELVHGHVAEAQGVLVDVVDKFGPFGRHHIPGRGSVPPDPVCRHAVVLGEALKIPPDANEPDGHSQNEDGFDPGYLTGYQASSGRAYRKQNLFGTDPDFGYLEPKAHQGAAASAGRVEPTPAAVPTSSPSSCLPERTPGDHGRG